MGMAPAGVPLLNFFSLGAGEVGARGIAFIATALLARRLGPDAFGVLGFATAVVSYFITTANAGLQDVASREVARRREDAARIAAGVVRVRLWLGVACLLLVGALAMLLPKPATVRAVVALSALSLLPLALNTAWVYKALGRTRWVSLGLIVGQGVFAATAVLLIHGPSDLLRVPILQALGELATALLLIPLLRGVWRSGSFRDGVATLRGTGIITVSRLLRTLIVTSDVVLLSFLTDDHQVGLYSAAYRVCFLLTAVATAAHVVFLPSLTETHDDKAAGGEVLTRSLWLSWTVSLPLVVGGMILAPDLLVLLFGPEFGAGGDAFRLLLFSILLLFLHGTLHNLFLVRDRLALETAIIAGAAAGNVMLNLLLIPAHGIIGSALATVVAEAMILAAGACVVAQWGWRPDLRPLARPAIAAAAMGTVLFLIPAAVHVTVRTALGGLVYVVALGVAGGLPRGRR